MKAVLDTMLWVSYCTRRTGPRHRLIDRALKARVRLFVSDYIIDELADLMLVAPADVESAAHTPGHLRGFAPISRVPLPFPAVTVASTNDPYMTLARARELAEAWNTEFVNAGPLGHINVAAGFGPWPVGEAIVHRLLAERRQPRLLTRRSVYA